MGERLKVSRFARAGFWLAAPAAVAAVLAGVGSREGWWHFGVGFSILKWAAYAAVAAAALSAIGVAATRRGRARGRAAAWLGLAAGLVVAGAPAVQVWTAGRVPPIHDIATDPDHPPVFSAIAPLRGDAANTIDYGGPAVAAQQRKAYPDLGPALLDLPPRQAFDAALAVARDMGWEIVDANPGQGRIEATDRTFWFGFKDDVVIRVAPTETGSRVDVRSLSRVGRSDVGTNAKRIRAFLARLHSSR